MLCENGKFKIKVDTDSETLSQGGKSFDAALRQCKIIWSGYTKFIRSQCNKGRLVDSIYFGSFYKKDEGYVCVHESGLTTVLNSENLASKGDLELEQTTVNIKAIAQVCGTSPDIVSNFLTKMKDLAVSFSKDKKRTVCLNISLGHMVLYPNQSIEFKSVDLNYTPVSQSQSFADRKQLNTREKSIFNSVNPKEGINSLLKEE